MDGGIWVGQRITINETVLASLRRQYPALSRNEILHAIVRAGPIGLAVHVELLRLCAVRAAERYPLRAVRAVAMQ